MHQTYFIAGKQEVHPAFQGVIPEYVTPALTLRRMADELGVARDAAAGHDRYKVAAKKALWEAIQKALTINAAHVTLLSISRNDPSLLDDSGYDHKQKNSNKSGPSLLDLFPEIFAKHTKTSGTIMVQLKRVTSRASVELQMSEHNPADESSYIGLGIFTKSRIYRKGLQPATKLYFRARYHEEGETGPWSQVVGIVVI